MIASPTRETVGRRSWIQTSAGGKRRNAVVAPRGARRFHKEINYLSDRTNYR